MLPTARVSQPQQQEQEERVAGAMSEETLLAAVVPPAPAVTETNKKPRRSAARGIAKAKENAVHPGPSSLSPSNRRRASRSPSSASSVLADSAGNCNDLSYRQEIRLVKHRMAGLQTRHDVDFEHALHPRPLLDPRENAEASKREKESESLSEAAKLWLERDHAANAGRFQAGAGIIARVFKQESRFEYMRRFNEWSAYARLQQMQRKRFPNSAAPGSKSDIEKMAQENQMLMDKLAASEEVTKVQRTANESLRRRAGAVKRYSASGGMSAR